MAEVVGLGLRIFGVLLCAALALATTGEAAGKVPGTLILRDALTLPNHSVRIEAQVAVKAAGPPLSGLMLHLQIDGKDVATAKTNEGGQAAFDYLAKMRGTNVISVSIDPDAPIAAEKVDATLCVWERRRPIVVVELDALIQQSPASATPAASSGIGSTDDTVPTPVPEAAEELSRLTQYYYNVVYVSNNEQGPMGNVSSGQVRRWLEAHPEMQKRLNWKQIPDRTTLSRRYKQLYPVVQAFVQFIGQYADTMDSRFSNKHLVEDKSLFKASGPVWHESDRQAGRVPEKLRPTRLRCDLVQKRLSWLGVRVWVTCHL